MTSDGTYVAKKQGRNKVTVNVGGYEKTVVVNSTMWAAHRGLLDAYPENSKAVFEAAGKAGAFAIETDVRFTKDGVPVTMHDKTVDSMTNGHGRIEDMTYEQAKRLKIDNGNGLRKTKDRSVPTLEEYLQICKKYGCVAVVELKGRTPKKESKRKAYCKKIYDLLEKYGLLDSSVVTSFNANYLKAFRKATGDRVPVGALNAKAAKKIRGVKNASGAHETKIGDYKTMDYDPTKGRKNATWREYRKNKRRKK